MDDGVNAFLQGAKVAVVVASRSNVFASHAVQIDASEPEDEFFDLDAEVRRLDSDPAKARLMQQARRWVGEKLFGDSRENLKALRLSAGLSQSAFARAMGTSQAAVSRWESGKAANMEFATIQKIARVLTLPTEAVCLAICATAQMDEQNNA